MKKNNVFGIIAIGMVLIGGYFTLEFFKEEKGLTTLVLLPELSVHAKAGKVAFAKNCQSCHGENGSGTEQGPTLIHEIYNPGHHSDQSFFLAVKNGVRAHHWPYGNMPPQRHVKLAEMKDIIVFIREIQQENGIHYKQHKM